MPPEESSVPVLPCRHAMSPPPPWEVAWPLSLLSVLFPEVGGRLPLSPGQSPPSPQGREGMSPVIMGLVSHLLLAGGYSLSECCLLTLGSWGEGERVLP